MDTVHFKPVSEFSELANKVFKEQKNRIVGLLPYAEVQHIGSTALPNSLTKGDLDVVIRVTKEEFKSSIQRLKSIYNINQPENWSNTFASFKNDENLKMDFGAQLVVKDSESDDFVQLRNLLLEKPDLLEKFNTLKRRYEGKSMEDYRKEKADFFQKLREEYFNDPAK